MKARRRAALLVISVGALANAYGCASVLGIDHEYVEDRGSAGGGSSSVTSSSGSGGAGHACASESDCPSSTDCVTYTCVDKKCQVTLLPVGTEIAAGKIAGDCRRKVCSGSGTVSEVNADDDPPQSPNPCSTKSCADGEIVTTLVQDNEPCGMDQYCQAGVCVGCEKMGDCPPPPQCNTVECTNQQCIYTQVPAGTQMNDIPGDCMGTFCDSNGMLIVMPNDNDEPQDADLVDCQVPSCVNGNLTSMSLADGSVCAAGGTRKCCDGVCCANNTDVCVNKMCCLVAKLCADECCAANQTCSTLGDGGLVCVP